MRAESLSAAHPSPSIGAKLEIVRPKIEVRLRSRIVLRLMRLVMKPLMTHIVRTNPEGLARMQLRTAAQECPDSSGFDVDYRVVGKVPGHVIGALDAVERPVVLWLHGGAFILPAAPSVHVTLAARICRDLGANGFLPDYRLGPFNRFPAGLDDCERAYRALLDLGHAPSRIVLGGDSAGGNLALGVLQRIRKAGLPMPACATLVSPVTEMGRIHSPPSRYRLAKSDPLLPMAALQRIDDLYAGDWDASDPELSPLYMDCAGMPPLHFLATDNEILVDETVMLAHRAHEAGVKTTCHVWPKFPHAFPLFEGMFPEVRPAREEIAAFARRHLASR